jgi:hypothetical protein
MFFPTWLLHILVLFSLLLVLDHKQECTYSFLFLAGPGAIMVADEL